MASSGDMDAKTQRVIDELRAPPPEKALEPLGKEALVRAVLAVHDAGVPISNEAVIEHLRAQAARAPRTPAGEWIRGASEWALVRIGGKPG